MIHGIYSADFLSNQSLFGRGIVVVDKENKLTGTMTSTGFTLAGHVHGQPQLKASIVATKQADLIDE